MILGTHNSGAGGRLVWWQRPFASLLHLTSRCQNRSIKEQLKDGVKLFNLQVTYYKGDWHFSHGLCIYEEKLTDALTAMKSVATSREPIYFQLYLDKNFLCGQRKEKFTQLVNDIKKHICNECLVMLSAWIEGSNCYPHKAKAGIDKREHYWTATWGKVYGKSLLDRLPLPYRHASIYNSKYRKECCSKYLMLDFYNV